jgi:hypothetical protein
MHCNKRTNDRLHCWTWADNIRSCHVTLFVRLDIDSDDKQ